LLRPVVHEHSVLRVLGPILAIINVSRFILPSDTVSLILELIAVIKIQALAGFALIIGQLLAPYGSPIVLAVRAYRKKINSDDYADVEHVRNIKGGIRDRGVQDAQHRIRQC
jgi:hypothetical protein